VRVETLPLPLAAPGTQRSLTVYRFGAAGAGPKAYIQSGLHSDELPPMLVTRHLIDRLSALPEEDILGEIVIVPLANPLGLDQVVNGELLGRFDLAGGGNYNRAYPDIADAVAARIDGRLSSDPAGNVALIRQAIGEVVAELRMRSAVEALRVTLFRMAVDADYVLDLHCDYEAVLHLYLGTPVWPDAADLAAQIGAETVLLARVSGGDPFDEASSTIWWTLAERYGDRFPIPPACLATTIEYRGRADVSDPMAADDADRLLRFLMRRGVVRGDPGPLPAPKVDATPLDGVDMLTAPHAGMVVYHKQLGEIVRAGETVCSIVDPVTGERTPLTARVDGPFWARLDLRFAPAGKPVAKIAGRERLPDRKGLLLTA